MTEKVCMNVYLRLFIVIINIWIHNVLKMNCDYDTMCLKDALFVKKTEHSAMLNV